MGALAGRSNGCAAGNEQERGWRAIHTEPAMTIGGKTVRHTVLFSGRVHGVGFRFTACHVASRHDVTGMVRNLADGRVELVAEGKAEQVKAFVEAVRRAMSGYIGSVDVQEGPGTGEFAEFGIGY